MGLVDEVAGIWILRGRFTVWERCRRRPSERNPRLEATWHKLIKGSVHTYYVCSLAARLQGLNGVVRMDVVHRFAIDHDNLVFGAAEVQVYTGSQVFIQQSNLKEVSTHIKCKRPPTYNSRPMAGPFGSTSDTRIDVSPSGCGLSLPPDIAKPNPSLESCHLERTKKKKKMRPRENDGQ